MRLDGKKSKISNITNKTESVYLLFQIMGISDCPLTNERINMKYKNIKMLLCMVLVSALLFSFTACGKAPESGDNLPFISGRDPAEEGSVKEQAESVVIAEPVASKETKPGYISEEIEMPAWIKEFSKSDVSGDIFYIVAQTNDGTAIAGYNTTDDSWSRFDLSIDNTTPSVVSMFSAADNSCWVIIRDVFTDSEIDAKNFSRSLYYYLIYVDMNSGEQFFSKIDWWTENDPYLVSLIALDDNRAILSKDGEKTYVIDSRAQIVDTPELSIMGDGLHAKINGDIYINSFDGLTKLNPETLQYENCIESIKDQSIYSSSLGNILTTKDGILYAVDPDTAEQQERFSWMDVSLSYRNLYGWRGLENSEGDIYHLTDKLIKVSSAEVPVKETLVLACFGDASEGLYDIANNSYICSDKLMEAILKFNNSDPEFHIEIKPYIYHDEIERSKMLIDISNGHDVDIMDTSMFQEGTIDSQLFIDLLPYIDADPNISRDDFIPSLLNSMMKSGKIYEYVDKYTMLSMYTHPEFVSKDSWTVEEIRAHIKEHPELRCPSDREQLIRLFSWAATGEFMDRSSGVCNFDNPIFADWLSLLKDLSSYEEQFDEGPNAYLFQISYDLVRDLGLRARSNMCGDYSLAGFPEADGSGSYFMKLGKPSVISKKGCLSQKLDMYTLNSATSLGILASSIHIDGAWRFLRTFMFTEDESHLCHGIPALKDGFDKVLENELNIDRSGEDALYEAFNQNDAEVIRELVYNTNKVVYTDETIMKMMYEAINAFLGGKYSAEEAASQIQSRMSIYMAEHS
ncbi:MAG: hypothetical protein ACOX68_07845 [Candidatus Limivicinus sp.]|jgi:hypothetical protein